MPGINPYRDEAIDSLTFKEPQLIGNCGGRPIWAWWGRTYTWARKPPEDRLKAILPDIAFDLLTGDFSSSEIHRGYPSKAAAMEALKRVRKTLEGEAPG